MKKEPNKTKITVAAPVYNEVENIEELYTRIVSVLKKMDLNYELIIVDDGSVDDTKTFLINKSKIDKNLKVIEFSRNFGLQAALSACLYHSRGDACIILDGDLQDPPELIPQMLEMWQNGADVVYTVKKSRKENVFKQGLFSLYYKIQSILLRGAVPVQAGNFSLLDKRVVSTITAIKEKNQYFPGQRIWCGFNHEPLYYNRDSRAHGKPKMKFFNLLKLGLDGIYNYTSLPLKFSMVLGCVILLLAFMLCCNVLYQKFVTHSAILGWTSTILIICLIGGIHLISIGILGEYIIRIFDNSKNRPEYIIKNIHTYGASEKE